MKKVVFTVVLCFTMSIAFGQKKALNGAKSEIKRENPNMEDARALIEQALEDAETKDDAETWYVAGSIEDKQLSMETIKLIKGAAPDESVMYPALLKIIPYFEKADELDRLPNEKGKIKPKFRKDMKAIISANINQYPNAGFYFYNKKDYPKAFQAYKQFVDIPDLPMFQEDKTPVIQKNDTNYLLIKQYAANMASVIEDHKTAIEYLESMKNCGYQENDVFRRLTYEYTQTADSVAILNILKEGVTKFPGDEFFLMNLIDKSIQGGRLQEAITYINLAIEQNPSDPILYDALGVIYENTNEPDKSLEAYDKALNIDPNYSKAMKHKGMVYYNLGVKARADADESSTVKTGKNSSEQDSQWSDFFKKALPLFEKSYEIDSTDKETVFCLRSIYYSLGMGPEFEKMDAIYTKEE